MLVKNNIAKPGEIKSVTLDSQTVEVNLRTGKTMRYERRDYILKGKDPERTENQGNGNE